MRTIISPLRGFDSALSLRRVVEWILAAGTWNDSNVWLDSETWNDGV